MSVKAILFVFAGGGLGSVVRFLITSYCPSYFPNFPLGILTSNIIASLLAALIAGYLGTVQNSPWIWFLFITGFAGGLSTFSTFSLDTYLLLSMKNFFPALLNVLLNITICLIVSFIGFRLGSSLKQ